MQIERSPSRTQVHHELMAPLTVIAGRTQLLQRQILRASGMSTLERDQLLGSVLAVLEAAQVLEARIEALHQADGRLSGVPEREEAGTPSRAE